MMTSIYRKDGKFFAIKKIDKAKLNPDMIELIHKEIKLTKEICECDSKDNCKDYVLCYDSSFEDNNHYDKQRYEDLETYQGRSQAVLRHRHVTDSTHRSAPLTSGTGPQPAGGVDNGQCQWA